MRLRNGAVAAFALAVVCGAIASSLGACSGWDPRDPFERNSPEVNDAIDHLDAGRLEKAEDVLEAYLGTGACSDGGLGLPDTVRHKPNGSFDLGLTLFYLAERFGQRFGDEDLGGDGGAEARLAEQRSGEIDCANIVVKAIAADPSVPLELRARAHYLAGNLEFLRKKYEDAVKQYDEALRIVPGILEEAGGDAIGRDAAWNRAIALRRIEDQKDAGDDAADGNDGDDGSDGSDAADGAPDADEPDAPDGDGGDDGGGDSGHEPDGADPESQGDSGPNDAAADASGDASPADSGADGPSPRPEPSADPQLSPEQKQDDRILDQLEEAPTYQEQEAKNRALLRRGRTMEDK